MNRKKLNLEALFPIFYVFINNKKQHLQSNYIDESFQILFIKEVHTQKFVYEFIRIVMHKIDNFMTIPNGLISIPL